MINKINASRQRSLTEEISEKGKISLLVSKEILGRLTEIADAFLGPDTGPTQPPPLGPPPVEPGILGSWLAELNGIAQNLGKILGVIARLDDGCRIGTARAPDRDE